MPALYILSMSYLPFSPFCVPQRSHLCTEGKGVFDWDGGGTSINFSCTQKLKASWHTFCYSLSCTF